MTDHNGLDVGHNSIAEDATASVIGEFSINAPDGLQGISVGAQNISADELADLSANPISVVGAEGTLTLTGYDPATGKVAYSYEQSGSAKDHSAGDDSVIDRFAITVTDLGGETSLPADLDILITDTAPEANADSNSVTEDSATPATGNVISDSGAGQDELGADNGNGAIDGDNSVHESGLTGGSSAGDDSHITSGSIEISAADGLASVTVGGQGFTLSQLQALSAGSPSAPISVEGGTLVLTALRRAPASAACRLPAP